MQKQPTNEAGLMRRVMLEASRLGMRLFRNNVGTGLVVRAKTSQQREAIISACQSLATRMGGSAARINFGLAEGSGDCIGWKPRVIRPEDVGKTIAQFASAEIKFGRGKSSEQQRQWASVVNAAGGVAVEIRDVDQTSSLFEVM